MAISTFRTVAIEIGDGASPGEQFTHTCTINTSRGIQFKSNGQDVYVPDCDNPEAPAWRLHNKTGLSATITGAGNADAESVVLLDTWYRTDTHKNVRVSLFDGLTLKGSWTGPFKLTDFQWTSDPMVGNPTQFTCTMESDGVVNAYVFVS